SEIGRRLDHTMVHAGRGRCGRLRRGGKSLQSAAPPRRDQRRMMPLDQRELRNCLGGFCTGVTVVTTLTGPDDRPIGVTVSSFNAVSLDPPLVLFSLDRRASALPAMEAAGRFAV